MLIVCPNCATSYDVEVASLRPDGRRVRCVRCRTVWQAGVSQADKLLAAAEALAPVRRELEGVPVHAGAAPVAAAMVEAAGHDANADGIETPGQDELTVPDEASADVLEHSDEGAAAADESPVDVDSPPIAPVDLDAAYPRIDHDHDAEADPEPLVDIERAAARTAARRARAERSRWPLSQLQSAILALIILDAIIVGWRVDFVRAIPQTASFYAWIGMPVNLRGLNFANMTTATEQHEGVPILVVQGNVINDTGKPADIPHIRFAVRNAARQEIYSWSAVPSRPMLPPGDAVSFHTRLASPPPDAHDVLVRFVNRYDVMTGAR